MPAGEGALSSQGIHAAQQLACQWASQLSTTLAYTTPDVVSPKE
jgi:hypothetical protein